MNTTDMLFKSELRKMVLSKSTIAVGLIIGGLIPILTPSGFSLGCMLVLYVLIYAVPGFEEQSKGYYFLQSLPVSRRTIVNAKYWAASMILVGATCFCYLFSLLGGLIQGGPTYLLPASIVWTTVLAGCVYVAGTMPLILHFGPTKARYYVFGLYLVMIVISSGALSLAARLSITNFFLSPFWMVLLCLVLMLISRSIALHLYCKKEFSD